MELFPYQQEAVSFLGYNGGIYADGPGTGKTSTTLRWLRQRQEPDELALVVVPKVMLGHWQREARTWYPELEVVPMVGTAQARERARDRAGRLSGDQKVPAALLTTYESMRQDADALAGFDGIFIADEAHRLKNRQALVTKTAAKITRRCTSVVFLTGTPILNRADDLWSLLRMLEPQKYRSFWAWANYYFEVEQTTFNYRLPRPITVIHGVKPYKLDELRAEVQGYMLHRPLRDLVDLPPLLHSLVPVTLGAKERKAYTQMKDHSWMDADGQIIQAENEVAKNVRLRQLASDWGVFTNAEGLGAKGFAACELVQSLVGEGEQVVVLTAYKETAKRLVTELIGKGIATDRYDGDVHQEDREEILDAFKGGALDVVVGTLATMGEGVDGLQVARHLVLIDRDWTPARNDQAIGRLLRRGQERPIVVHHVFAEGTIDEDVALACANKTEIIEAVIGA